MTATSAPHAAAVEYLAQHWPGPDSRRRNHSYLALAGGLLRAGLAVERAEAIVEALAEATDDEEGQKRIEGVGPTAEKIRQKKPTTGWPKLAEILGEDGAAVVREFRLKLGIAVSLAQLAEHKKLPVEFLQSLGLYDLPLGGVAIPYRDAGGRTVETKERTDLRAGDGSYWPKGKPLLAYGEEHLDAAVKAGYLSLVEGESDVWTLRYHDEPALGLPGNDTVEKTLHLGHVAPFQRVFVHQENDQGGEVFVDAVRRRLAALGWQGELRRTHLDSVKDPSALHVAGPERFKERWQRAREQADVLPLTVPATPAAPALPADPPWPEPLAEEALYGLAGDVVRVLGPASEAHPAALLGQVLVGFGNLIGRTAYFRVEADRHHGNEFLVLTGKSSKSRKGTSWGQVRGLLLAAEEAWATQRVQTGLSSGEGLIWHVRDPIRKQERVKDRGQPVRYEEVEADPGIADKRLLVVEPEYANVLKQTERQGNVLSAVLRQAWESGDLATLTKNSPTRATGAHVSLIGHVTAEELRRYLTTTEMANGFANRHLWLCVQRSKELPEGGRVDEAALTDLQQRLATAMAAARQAGEMSRDEEARVIWREVYGRLSADRPGLTGAMLSRAEAHVLRLSLLYALLDCSPVIQAPHLMAALAVWEYAGQSVHHIFGDALGDPVADELARLLRAAPDGMSRSEMYNAFGRNQSSERIGRALALLAEHGLVRFERRETGGRPEERWRMVGR